MWHFEIWFSRHCGVGWMVGLDDLRGLFQPMILCHSGDLAEFLTVALRVAAAESGQQERFREGRR